MDGYVSDTARVPAKRTQKDTMENFTTIEPLLFVLLSA